MESNFCKTKSINVFPYQLWRACLRRNLNIVGFLLLFLSSSFIGFCQTTPLSFTAIPFSSNEIIGPGRGAEDWYNAQGAGIPTSSSNDSSVDTYWRFTWEDIQDYTTGAFKWTYFDAKIDFAIDGGRKFNFGVYAFNPSYGPNVGGSTLNYPLVVHNAMQAEPVYKDAPDVGGSYPGYNSWTPNWNAPSFRTYYNALQDAIINHLKTTTYKGVLLYNAVGIVDIRAFGNTGEWTGYNNGNNPAYMPANTVATSATQIQFIDDMIAKWPDKQLSICIGAVLGTTVSDAPQGGDAVGYHVFTTSNSVGHIGLRRDCLGQTDAFVHTFLENNTTVYNGLHFNTAIMNNYQLAPFRGEPCNCCMIAGDPLNQGISYWDLPRQITFYHHASFGDGNLYLPGSTAQVNQEMDSVRRASKNAGYRLILTGGSMTTSLVSGGGFNITLNWQNTGITPNYENWNLVYELRKSDGTVVWTGNSAFQLRLFLPQTTATPASDNFTLSAVAAGTYNMYLIIRDPANYRKPLPLAINGRNADGSYLLRSNITIGTGPANQPPTAQAGADQTIQLPLSTVSLSGTGTDPDGTISLYAWSKLSGPAGNVISTPATANTNITGLIQGIYQFILTVTDNLGATGSDTVQVTVNAATLPANQPPVANAGSDQTMTLPANSGVLNGSGSSDPDGSITNYLWTKISGPSQFTIGNNGTASTTVNNLTAGLYSFQLKVTDNSGATALDTVIITVNAAPVNQPPVANAGADITITLPTNLTNLVGTASNDPDGAITTYAWSQVSGPGAAAIASPASASTGVSGLQQGVYVFALKVTDNGGATDLDSVRVTVNPAPNMAPVANAGASKSITQPANSTSLDGTLSTDPDGTIVAWAWAQTAGPSTATITNGNAALATASNLVPGQYTFTLTVTDNSGATSNASVKITEISSGAQPPIANAGADQTITLPNSTVTIDASGSSAPAGNIVSYTWTEKSGPSVVSLSNTVQNTINNLKAGVYIFSLTVTDNNGDTGMDSVIITVVPSVNKPPVANAGPSISLTLPNNSTTLDGSSSSDPDGTITAYSWTEISGPNTPTSSGSTTAVLNLSGLIVGQYTYQLTVTDNSGATSSAQVKVKVAAAANVLPVADAGPAQTITSPASSVILNGSGSYDPDGTIQSYNWVRVTGPGSTTITSSNTATPTVSGLQTGQYTFQLTVTDNSGATATGQVVVTVLPKTISPNQPPVANAGSDQTITAPASTVSLNGSSSSDPDGTIAGYSWTQVSGPSTALISAGNTSVAGASQLIVGQYVFQLKVTDNNGATGTDQVTITVNPAAPKLNQPPVADAGPDQTITSPASSVILNGSGSHDPDGTIQSYNWVTVSGPGSITISNSNTATPAVSGLQTGQYIFQLTVTDNNGATATGQVMVTVLPKTVLPNQSPVANAGNNQIITAPASSVSLNGTSSFDPDGSIAGYSWTQVSGPSAALISAANTSIAGASQLVPGQYVFQLTVTDNNGATGTDQVIVTVNAAAPKLNVPPVADAGRNDTISLPDNTYSLNGSQSMDPDGTITSYQWQQIGGPNTVTNSSMNSEQVNISDLQAGQYEFQLTVTDNEGLSSTSEMTLTVKSDSSVIGDALTLYPNPAHDVINGKVVSAVTGSVKIYVYDMNGKLVMVSEVEKSDNSIIKTMNISPLASGMYTILINIANRKTMVAKFIKD